MDYHMSAQKALEACFADRPTEEPIHEGAIIDVFFADWVRVLQGMKHNYAQYKRTHNTDSGVPSYV